MPDMKARISWIATLFLLVGCENANLGAFTGTPWKGPLSVAGLCSDGAGSHSRQYVQTLKFEAAGRNAIEYTNDNWCVFRFNVSGNTATLSKPVVCGGELATGLAGELTYTKYTITANDEHHLALELKIHGKSGVGLTCEMSGNGAVSR
jgi:hypothetical protein